MLHGISFNWSTIVKSLELFSTDDDYKNIENLTWSLVPLYPSCQIIDIRNYTFDSTKSLKYMYISLGDIENLEVSLRFQGSNKILTRSLKSNILSYSGPTLTIKDQKREIRAIVRMSQKIYNEEDNTARCTNYPNAKYKDYNECDEMNVHDTLKSNFSFTPVWATRDFESVTKLQKYAY